MYSLVQVHQDGGVFCYLHWQNLNWLARNWTILDLLGSSLSRSEYSNHTKSPTALGRTTADGCQSNCSRPPSPNQQPPSGRQSPSMMGLPNSEMSRGREVGSSGRVPNAGGEPTPGNLHEAASSRAPSPKPSSARTQASPARQGRVHGDRGNPSPSRARASKTPPNRSPLKTHFSRRQWNLQAMRVY